MTEMATVGSEVLMVCTGNICRSPLAEQFFAHRLASPGLTYSSAGTRAMVGADLPEPARREARRLGFDPVAHAARQLEARHVEGAHLVLTATRTHRAAVVRLVPRAARYAFTIREFARLSELAVAESGSVRQPADGEDVGARLRSVVTFVASMRGLEAPRDASADDIPDPYGRDDAAYRLVGDALELAAPLIARAFAHGGLRVGT